MHLTDRIQDCFEIFAHNQPDSPAIITDDNILTYSQLNQTADILAGELTSRGATAGEAVGVLVERSEDLPGAFLAILKAGCIYVPLVADLPPDRLANFAQQAGIRRLFVLGGIQPPDALVAAVTGNGASEASDSIIRPETVSSRQQTAIPPLVNRSGTLSDLAVILFTSGSTGTPKGVMIQHDALANMALGHIEAHGINSQDRILLSTSPGFILGFRELCLPLMCGAAYVPVSRTILNSPDTLLAHMGRHRVSLALFTPSYLRLLKGSVPDGLRCIVTAGERPNADDARHYAAHIDYWNVHGATEVCGTICMHRVTPDSSGPLPSGQPFANTSVYLLDPEGMEVPAGEVGEIHVVGIGVARGYLQQPDLTAETFVETRFGRAYRSHDLARWNQDGNLETIGRSDDSVKISGQTVSLGEIENALVRHPDVTRAAALQLQGRLVACVEYRNPDQAHKVDWREYLGRTLARYMIPAQVAELPALPISSAGKVDRRALLEIASPLFENDRRQSRGTAPQGELEQAIARLWEELLDMRPIRREDNFFTVGGTSLLAIVVSQRLQNLGYQVSVQTILATLTVEALAARIREQQEQGTGSSGTVAYEHFATADQTDFWIAAKIGLPPGASHIVRILGVTGNAPPEQVWHGAWNRLIDRHPALRTAFFTDQAGRVRWQTITFAELIPAPLFSFDQCATVEEARELVAGWANLSFNLTTPPLARAGLITVSQNSELLFWFVLHHSVVDGMSASLIQEELLELLAGRQLPPVADGIALASHAQQQYLASDRAEHDSLFWHAKLDSLVARSGEAFHEYVTPHPRPAMASGHGAPPLSERLDAATVRALVHVAQAHGTGLHAVLLAILAAEIRHREGKRDILIGSGISVRPAGGESAVGHFVNLLPVVLPQSANASFLTLLQEAQASLTETVEHAAYPAGRLSREFRQRHPGQRGQSRTSLFDIALTAILPRTSMDRETGLTLAPRLIPGEREYVPTGLDLSFSHEPCLDGGLNLLLVWNPDVCTENGAAAWLASFTARAIWLAEEPGRAAAPFPEQLPHEAGSDFRQQELPEEWNATDRPYLFSHCVHELVAARAAAHPDATAVVAGEQRLTYAELDSAAQQLAARLSCAGVVPGKLVALCLERSIELVIACLAALKTGAAYLPLDPSYPRARLSYMLQDSDAPVVVTCSAFVELLSPCGALVICLDEEEHAGPFESVTSVTTSNDLAYVIYTSGSTGNPKGVEVEHRALLNLVSWHLEEFRITSADRATLLAGVGFDASVWEIWPYLVAGATLLIPDDEIRTDPELLRDWLLTERITVTFLPTPLAENILQVEWPAQAPLRTLLTGGDRLHHYAPPGLPFQLVNNYGPTENAVVSTSGVVPENSAQGGFPSIGRPIANNLIRILDPDGHPLPSGIAGEICVGGLSLARGYLKRPELTAERFVPDPFGPGRLYRTGDLGQWRNTGEIEFLGRLDQQVKIRGFRIELGEIEAALQNHPVVREAVVLAREDQPGDQRLVAYVTAKQRHLPSPDDAALADPGTYVEQWQTLYDQTFSDVVEQEGAQENYLGWNSSYTGDPIPLEEMREWTRATTAAIAARGAQRILEIGCGTGLMLGRLAPGTAKYWGTDFSSSVLAHTRSLLAARPDLGHVVLSQRTAIDFTDIEPHSFDAVILNSIIQYFPEIDYLRTVLEGAVNAVAPGGFVYVGDVFSLPLLEAYALSVLIWQAEDGLTAGALRERVQRRTRDEEELVVAPEFFHALQRDLPKIGRVSLRPKRGRAHNELTRFRYEVVLEIGVPQQAAVEPEWHAWPAEATDVTWLTDLMAQSDADACIGIRGIPNARLAFENMAMAWLDAAQETETVERVQSALPPAGIEPEALWELAGAAGWRMDMDWSRSGKSGVFDVAFYRGDQERAVKFNSGAQPEDACPCYANDPLQATCARKLVPDLRNYLSERLPEYMLPGAFVVLESLPLNANGKIDRGALPPPERIRPDMETPFVAPRTGLEQTLAAVWGELLGVERVGAQDNFFALGGNSLLAVMMAQRVSERLGQQLSARLIFVAPTVAAFASKIATRPDAVEATGDATNTGATTEGEREFWVAESVGHNTSTFTMPINLEVIGEVAPERWRTAWAVLVARHEGLRTYFEADDSCQPRRRIAASLDVRPEIAALADRTAALAHIRQRQAEPLSMQSAPLWRTGLVESMADGAQYFWLAMHHSIGDGHSIGTLLDELAHLLSDQPLAPAGGCGSMFATREHSYLSGPDAGEDADYWRTLLQQVPDEAFEEWQLDAARSSVTVPGMHRFELLLDPHTTEKIVALARSHRASLHAVMLALIALDVRRWSGRCDMLIGTTASTRESADEAGIVGYGVNMLPLYFRPATEQSFGDLLHAAQRSLADALQHARYPFARIYRDFWSRRPGVRHPRRFPLFDIVVTENPDTGPHDTPLRFSRSTAAIDCVSYERSSTSPGQDMILLHELLSGGGLLLQWHVNASIYSRETAGSRFNSLVSWLRWLAEDPARPVQNLPRLLPHETALLEQWEAGEQLPVPQRRSHEIFEELADLAPDAVALVTPGEHESRARLDARANGLAFELMRCGMAPGSTVAVLTVDPQQLPATVLGIWKAGGVYLPLPQQLPATRLAAMASDAAATVLVVLDSLEVPEQLSAAVATIIRPEQCSPTERRPYLAGSAGDRAYIIYTSGTTGMPKGVPVTHAAYGAIIFGVAERVGIRPDDRMALVASVGFDASLWELGHGLLNGIALVPITTTLRDDPWQMKQYYAELGVTIAFHTPSYLRVSEQTPFQGVRILLIGGEPPNHRDLEYHAGQLEFWNFYGPTETTIVVSGGRIMADHAPDAPLPVGRPLANTRISVRRADGTPVPPGVVAEIWLGGAGLSQGYLNCPELTDASFVTLPEGRFYRTGDQGRWTADGQIVLSGRMDDQVKLNGQRVELGEIEQALRMHRAVREAIVLVDSATDGAKVVRAFVRFNDDEVTESALAAFLSEQLPAHMLPASITPLAAMPLTPAGKVDRGALLEHARREITARVKQAPHDPLEISIAAIWSDILGLPVARDDNFFALGGNSLLAVTVTHRVSKSLGKQVSARSLFAAPTLAGFCSAIADGSASSESAAAPTETELASEGEQEFWVAEAAGLATATFTIPIQLRVQGDLSAEQLRQAWSLLVERHEGLRTSFGEDGSGQLKRVIGATLDVTLENDILPDRVSGLAHIRRRQSEALTMSLAPLWRAGLVTIEEDNEQLFWLALHHSVGDGQSIGILLDELTRLLDGAVLPPPSGGGRVLATRNAAYLAGPEAARDADYWQTLLQAAPDEAFAEWPLDRPRSPFTPHGMHRLAITLDRTIAEGLRSLARAHAASCHAVMLTLLALETGRRTGRGEILIGTTASIRESLSEARIVGYGVNMLPLRLSQNGEKSFGELLRQTQQHLGDALQHARYPFARIYRTFWNKRPALRHPQRYPLFDIAVTEHPGATLDSAARFSRMTAASSALSYEYTAVSPGQDLVLMHEDCPDGSLLLLFHVNAAIYDEQTARDRFATLIGWARWLAAEPGRPAQPLPPLLPEQRQQLEAWEQGAVIARPQLRFERLFEQRVDQPGQSQRPAIVMPDGVISYRELDQQANAIAHALAMRGVNAHSVVGVLTGRSVQLPATLLGIWKAGGIYLPLASDLPDERLAFMHDDAGVTHLIALDGLELPATLSARNPALLRPELLSGQFRTAYRDRPAAQHAADAIAYILYTSGSTGLPKGTLISHDSYLNLVLGGGETIGFGPDDRSMMFASPSFDVSLSDIGVPLAFGAAVCPLSIDIIQSPRRLFEYMEQQRITVADLTPTYLRLLDGAPLPSSLHTLITGGEPPLAADVQRYAPQLRYFNAYGPTENSITSSMGLLKDDQAGCFSTGRPLPNTTIRICDPQGEAVPPGVTGEIWLGGIGLSRGYLNRPELTLTSFVNRAGKRYYRSGDLGRWQSDGTLEVLGRSDDQVKLNGIRIELGEIEGALASHPAILQAVVLLVEQSGGSKSLWGVICPQPGQELAAEHGWQAHLSGLLPSFMIPSGALLLTTIPLTSSGKVDRGALLALCAQQASPTGRTAPQDELEQTVADVWSELLGRSPISREDNFFSLGGHSLLAIAVAQQLEKKLGRPVPPRELFAEPTLAAFSARLRTLQGVSEAQISSSDLATEGQREFWTAEQAGLDTRGFNISLTLDVHGVLPSVGVWHRAWQTLISRHELLRSGFFEDESGIVRRRVVAQADATLEQHTSRNRAEALEQITTRQSEPFTMADPGLWRAGLVQLTESGETIFWLVLHHSVADGLSLGILLDELKALLHGETPAPQTTSFDVTAGKEQAYLASAAASADAAYWQQQLDDLIIKNPAALDEWPLDKLRPHTRSSSSSKGGNCYRSRLDAGTANALRCLAQDNRASLHALMLAILGIEVRRRTGRPDFLLGTAASTRQSAAEAQTVGYFVNMLPLPFRGEATTGSMATALQAMQQSLAESLQHCHYPFARIYGNFRQAHPQLQHPGRYPLFDIAVTENPGGTESHTSDLWFSSSSQLDESSPGSVSYELRHTAPAQDLVLIHETSSDGTLVLTWFANAALYSRDTAHSWFEGLLGWMRYLADGGQPQTEALPALLPAEQSWLETWQSGPRLPLPATSFPDFFRQQAETNPERAALVTDAGVRSYGEINSRADFLATLLLRHDLKRGEAVAVYTERSATLPETVLAIWKAGGCYLPLSADLPAERLAFIANDAVARIMIVLDALPLPEELGRGDYTIIRPEEHTTAGTVAPLPDHIAPHDHAYIIYTSGSTGIPKGVLLCHGGLLNLSVGITASLGINPADRVLQISSPSFDAWISDLVLAWGSGAAVVPVRREQMNHISGMRDLFQRLGVTVATMPPSYLRLFEQSELPGMRILMTAGEAPILDDVQHYAAQLSYFNGYGPTENTVAASIGLLSPGAEPQGAGRPMANTSICIVNQDGCPVAPGVVGEIWLGGAGLAVGYLNRPDQTAASFVVTNGERRYRTGDLGRWLASGELQVLGRLDTQVKLRGQRVELGEIEYRLANYPGVRQAVAVVETKADQTQVLWAFVALNPETLEPGYGEWSAYLSESLPRYMIPSAVLAVAAIPVTPAGKVDRRALLESRNHERYQADNSHDSEHCAAPQTSREKRIAAIWSELFNQPFISRDSDFFNLGGDSLRAIAVISRLRREFDCQVNDLYEHPVLSEFARICRPRRDHLRELVKSLHAEWNCGGTHVATEADREEALRARRSAYAVQAGTAHQYDLSQRNSYRHVLLTGATGYLGSYLLRELLGNRQIRVTALVRGNDDHTARERLGQVLLHYFGETDGAALRDNPNLTVLAGDLRQAELGLSPHDYGHLMATVDVIYHSAANVNHFGHYRDFHADNVLATRHLLSLAAARQAAPADFHYISTLSAVGSTTGDEFKLFTEFDLVPEQPDDNYYIRTKQEAERMVIAARGELNNACIHRVGNIVFSSDDVRLQRNMTDNAFFRQLSAFVHLGVVPLELHASLCYVDIAARAIVALADTKSLTNQIYHIEKSNLDLLADFIRSGDGMSERVDAKDFGGFLERLQRAIDEPEMEKAVAESVETFGIRADRSPLARFYRLAIASDHTQILLDRLGVVWPSIPAAGQNAMLRSAMEAPAHEINRFEH